MTVRDLKPRENTFVELARCSETPLVLDLMKSEYSGIGNGESEVTPSYGPGQSNSTH